MGGKSSKESSWRDYYSYGSTNSSSSNQNGYPPASPYPYPSPQHNSYYTSQNHHAPAPSSSSYPYESQRTPQHPQKRLDRKYSRIADNYKTLDQVGWAIITCNFSASIYGSYGLRLLRVLVAHWKKLIVLFDFNQNVVGALTKTKAYGKILLLFSLFIILQIV